MTLSQLAKQPLHYTVYGVILSNYKGTLFPDAQLYKGDPGINGNNSSTGVPSKEPRFMVLETFNLR